MGGRRRYTLFGRTEQSIPPTKHRTQKTDPYDFPLSSTAWQVFLLQLVCACVWFVSNEQGTDCNYPHNVKSTHTAPVLTECISGEGGREGARGSRHAQKQDSLTPSLTLLFGHDGLAERRIKCPARPGWFPDLLAEKVNRTPTSTICFDFSH